MSLYLVPELRVANGEIVNILGKNEQPVGFLSLLFSKEDNKMYAHACLQEKGVEVDFLDLLGPYIEGVSRSLNIKEVSTYICVGGEERSLYPDSKEDNGKTNKQPKP